MTELKAKKNHVDRMQENGKEQDEEESTSGKSMFHLGTKRTKRERERERDYVSRIIKTWLQGVMNKPLTSLK